MALLFFCYLFKIVNSELEFLKYIFNLLSYYYNHSININIFLTVKSPL